MCWCILFLEWWQYVIRECLPDVYQHVRVREPLHRSNLIPLQRRRNAIEDFAAVILLKDLAVCHRRDPVIVELEPPASGIRFDTSEVMSAMEIPGVNEHTMKFVDPWL
jgi:hypothetical protein